MIRQGSFDPVLFIITLLLLAIGIIMVYSSSFIYAQTRFGDGLFFIRRELLYASLGLSFLLLCTNIPYRFFTRLSLPLLALTLLLLIMVLATGWGTEIGGSRRWLKLGSLSFQPSEIAKFSLVIYLSRRVRKSAPDPGRPYPATLPFLLVTAIFIFLTLLQPDFVTAIIMAILSFTLLFIAATPLRHLAGIGLVSLPILVYLTLGESSRIKRVLAFAHPWSHSTDSGFQLIQSFLAFGSGGIWGQGLGEGGQKLLFLPEAHNDFIFSVIAEELGLIGVLGVLSLFFLLIIRGSQISLRCPAPEGRVMAIGLTSAIALQAFINIAVTMGLLPTKGLTLPFISYGGTSLIINCVSVGILLNISRGLPPTDKKRSLVVH